MNNALQGHRARKRFGQNFLHDQGIIESIVDIINPQPDEALVEIGPGLAALTEPVADRCEKLHVIELDRDLASRLESHPFLQSKLVVHRMDALKFDFSQLSHELGKPLRVFGNLPYNISTPLIFHILSHSTGVQDMHFMLQKEVVDRMAAGPGSKTFGRLSVMVQQSCQVAPVLNVPPGAFNPPPKVDSAVVRLTPYDTSPWPVADIKMLNHVCHTAFNQRRKTLRNNMKKLISAEKLEKLGLDPTSRPETLDVKDFVAMSNWLTEQNIRL